MSMCIGSLAKAIGPAVASPLFAWSVSNNDTSNPLRGSWLVFSLCGVLLIIQGILGLLYVRQDEDSGSLGTVTLKSPHEMEKDLTSCSTVQATSPSARGRIESVADEIVEIELGNRSQREGMESRLLPLGESSSDDHSRTNAPVEKDKKRWSLLGSQVSPAVQSNVQDTKKDSEAPKSRLLKTNETSSEVP